MSPFFLLCLPCCPGECSWGIYGLGRAAGVPGARLVDMVVDPMEILDQAPDLRLHGTYYITKQVSAA